MLSVEQKAVGGHLASAIIEEVRTTTFATTANIISAGNLQFYTCQNSTHASTLLVTSALGGHLVEACTMPKQGATFAWCTPSTGTQESIPACPAKGFRQLCTILHASHAPHMQCRFFGAFVYEMHSVPPSCRSHSREGTEKSASGAISYRDLEGACMWTNDTETRQLLTHRPLRA